MHKLIREECELKHNLKKAVALCSALVCIGTFASVYPKESYAAENVLLGDADGNGQVNINDAISISQFLLGKLQVTPAQFTAMDINQDGAVTKTDALMVQYVEAGSIAPVTVNKELYAEPDQNSRSYYRHMCNSSDVTSKIPYTIQAPNALTADSVLEYEEVSPMSEIRDNDNTNVVQLDLNGYIGSGFIVGSHIIATAAHCVYNDGEFIDNIKVNIYNKNGTVNSSNLVHTSTAKELHIPRKYVYPGTDAPENFDYALIYVEDDLSEYGVWSMGVLSDNFMNSGRPLTTSGFTILNNEYYARYYSEGSVISPADWGSSEEHNLPIYRLHAESQSYGGKSGGVTYYKSDYDDVLAKSAVGVNTGSPRDTHYSWAVRMNPNLIWFYKQNPEAGK